jgi:predicted nucleic acid-binding protein
MTTRPVIVDASGPLALVLGQPEAPAMLAAWDRWSMVGTRVLVPDHFWLEITNPLLRRHRWSAAKVAEALQQLEMLSAQIVPVDRPILLLAVDMAERHGLTTYDATYAALAQVTGGTLATFDRALRQAVPDLLEPGFGDPPARRVNEEVGRYGSEPARPAPDRSSIGSYLGVLRRRALADAEAGRR